MIQEGLHPLGQWGESIKEKMPGNIAGLFYELMEIDSLRFPGFDLTYAGMLEEIRSQFEKPCCFVDPLPFHRYRCG